LLYAAQLDEGLATRFFGRHARVQIVVNMHLEMAFDLVGKLAVAPLPAE
jgi:hypothetical protein